MDNEDGCRLHYGWVVGAEVTWRQGVHVCVGPCGIKTSHQRRGEFPFRRIRFVIGYHRGGVERTFDRGGMGCSHGKQCFPQLHHSFYRSNSGYVSLFPRLSRDKGIKDGLTK